MKKKLKIIIALIIVVVFIIMCAFNIKIYKIEDYSENGYQSPVLSSEEIIDQVLRGEKEFVGPQGNEIYLSDLIIEDSPAKINQYTYVDIDGDSENELVGLTDSFYGKNLILNIDNNVIYGIVINSNEMEFINNNGVILDKVYDSIYYRTLKFNKNTFKKRNLASHNEDEYMIDGEVVEEVDFNNYQEEYASFGLVKYKALYNGWMEKTLSNNYEIKEFKDFRVNSPKTDFMFAIDKEFENFKSDFLSEKISMYYINSTGYSGKIKINRIGDNDFSKYSEEVNNNKSICIYDEETQYIALIINNDRLDSWIDNNYDIYYFKYYNKNIQLLGNYISDNFNDLFNEDVISELE